MDKTVEEALALADEASTQVNRNIVLTERSAEVDSPAPAPAMAAAPWAAPADAAGARKAAKMAKAAAKVANQVATQSVQMAQHAKAALKRAHKAVNRARVETEGLSNEQKVLLKKAEKKLKDATKNTEYGQVVEAKYANADAKMDKIKSQKSKADIHKICKEINSLKKKLKAKDDAADVSAIKELHKKCKKMAKDPSNTKSHDELKAEVEKLRQTINKMPDPKKAVVKTKATKVQKSIDIDTAMPYG